MTTERKTIDVATLDASVRLVAIQFMMPTKRVPAVIQSKRASAIPPMEPVSGVEVLESTKDVDISPLVFRVNDNGSYELVDAWKKPHDTNWRMSVVRFVYCRKEFVRHDELFPDFVAKRDKLVAELTSLVSDNLWTVQGHLNPYCEPDGSRSGQDVLMLGCVARKPNVEVFQDGRDPVTKQGIGPKVMLGTISSKLRLVEGEWVQLELRVQPKVKSEINENDYTVD